MGYYDEPAKPIETREDKRRENHDKDIDEAIEYCKHGDRTDAASQGEGYLGMDDLDRLRRRHVKDVY